MATAFTQPRPAGAGWGWIVGYGILSLLLALFSFAQPFAATLAATVVLGVSLAVAGIVSLAAGLRARGHEGAATASCSGCCRWWRARWCCCSRPAARCR